MMSASASTRLLLIQQRLFTEAESVPAEFKGSCTIVSCSGMKDEVLTVAKEILKLVYRDGFPFESIGVVARSTEPYLSWFQEIFTDHSIPMATTAKSSILSFPLVKAVFLLGGLLTSDYLRSQVIDLLSSPYFNLEPYSAKEVPPRWDLWDPLTRQMGIVKGFEEWRRLERHLKAGVKLQGREEEAEESYETPVTADQVEILWSIIAALHDDLERLPLEAAWSDFAMRWETLLFKYLGLERRVKSRPTSSREEQIGDIVLETLDAVAQMRNLLNGGQIEYETYKATVISIMKDFIDSFPEDRKLNYVVNEIKDSPFAPFVDDEIHHALIKYVLSSVAGTHKE